MFRFLKPRQTVLTTARLPMRYELMRQNGQSHNVQRVRFMKPWFRWKPAVMYCAAVYLGCSVLDAMVLEPLARNLDETLEDLPDDGEEEGEEEEGSLFIPFPGTTKQLEPKPYRGSDPEWQAFIKFSKDQELVKRVRDELANFVRTVAEKHPLLSVKCGKQMKLRRYWLDVDFPTHPPPEFERTGIEITDDFIAIATVPVDSMTVARTRNVLWPSPLMRSFWSFTKVFLDEEFKSVSKFLGIQAGSPDVTIDEVLAKHAELTRLPPSKKDKEETVPSPLPPPIQSPGRETIPTRPEVKALDDNQPGLLQKHFMKPMMAFKTMIQQTWKPVKDFPPRGSILVTGFVEVDSPRAWLVFDVRAAWNPKTTSYDPRSMVLSLRRLQMKNQGPIGGA